MKKIFYRSLLLLLPFGAFISCGHNENQEGKNNEIEFFSYNFNVLAQLADSLQVPVEGGEYCQVKGQGVLPAHIGDYDVTMLRDSLCNLGQVILLEKDMAQPILEPGVTIVDAVDTDTSACSVSVNELSVDLLTPQIIVWKDYYYNFLCGAAHGMYSTTYVNFSLELKKILELNDIFSEGYENELTNMVRTKLLEEKVPLLVPIDEVKLPSDFRLTTHSIEFVFSLYEIAPYSEGEIKIELNCTEIEDGFKPDMEKIIFGKTFN